MRSFLTLLPFLISLPVLAQTSTIQGHVFDADKNKPLPNAHVYLANTTRGDLTDNTGAFHIPRLTPGHYRLIVSYIGFATQVIEVNTANAVTYKILLKPSLQELNEVVIRSKKQSYSEWLGYFNMFKEHFIGQSENHRSCTFENPRVLNFYKKDNILTAYADSSVVIDNLGLGYKIRLFLEKYEYNVMLYRTHYEQQIVFEKLAPTDKEQELQWAKARLKAYYGSEMEFLRALYKRDLNNIGYYFVTIRDQNFGKSGGVQRIGWSDTVKTPRSALYNYKRYKVHTVTNYNRILDSLTSTVEEPVLKFKGELRVEYIHESESYTYQTARHRGIGKATQVSNMKLLRPAVIQPNGQLYPPDAVETSGYWSWELMAESLPLDYDPEEDIKLTGFRILTQEELTEDH